MRDNIYFIYYRYLDIFVSKSCYNKVLQPGVLKQQKFIPSQFWRSEVLNQGVGRVSSFLKTLGEDPSLLLPASGGFRCSLTCGNKTQTSASICTGLLSCVSPLLSVFSFLIKHLSLNLESTWLIQDDLI